MGGAAVQLAAAWGAKVIALIKSERDHERLDQSKIAAIAHSDSSDIAGVVHEATGGRGCDLAINGIGGSLFQPMLDALADGGRMVVLSAIGGREVPLDLLTFYRRRLTLVGLNTVDTDIVQGARIMDQLTPLFESGVIAPPKIAARYPLSQAAEAYGRLAEGVGKVALFPNSRFPK
ncbi:MAG: zinc-binding dehydrogenase [Janthinobacterium lividum]